MRLNKNHIYAIVCSVSLLILCLVFVQLYWVKDVYRFKKILFDERVNKMLDDAVVFTERCVFSFNLYGRSYIQPGEGVTVLKANQGSKQFDTISLFNAFPYPDKPDTCFYSTGFSVYDMLTVVDVTMRFEYIKNDSAVDANAKNMQFSTMQLANYKTRLDDNTPIGQRISLTALDSTIRALAVERGIDTGYVYGLKRKNTLSFEYLNDPSGADLLLSKGYKKALFANRAFTTPYELYFFPLNKDETIKSSLTWALIGSAFIIMLLVAAFIYFARTILQQKKISTMKTDFINNMTHEFMTPVTNISLAVETLEKGKSSKEQQQQIISLISSENSHLRDNINKVLQVATLDKSDFLINPSALHINDILERVARNFEMQIESKGGRFVFGFSDEDIIIIADETHIINLFYNIIDNAIKYSSTVPPLVTIKTGIKDNKAWVSIEDNGIGMSPDTQKHVFEKFYRGHKGNLHDVKGFGLGLSYVKSIADAHGISVEVKSRQHMGTVFTIWFNQ